MAKKQQLISCHECGDTVTVMGGNSIICPRFHFVESSVLERKFHSINCVAGKTEDHIISILGTPTLKTKKDAHSGTYWWREKEYQISLFFSNGACTGVCQEVVNKARIPVMPDGTPHNRILNEAGQSIKVISRNANQEPIFGVDHDDQRFRVTDSGGWYFVPEKCPRQTKG